MSDAIVAGKKYKPQLQSRTLVMCIDLCVSPVFCGSTIGIFLSQIRSLSTKVLRHHHSLPSLTSHAGCNLAPRVSGNRGMGKMVNMVFLADQTQPVSLRSSSYFWPESLNAWVSDWYTKVRIKSPWTVAGFSQIIYFISDYQRLCKQLPKLAKLQKFYSMMSCLMNVD